jgi:hypothetical protein
MYFQTSTLPNPIITFIRNESGSVDFEKSPDNLYLMVYYDLRTVIRIYNLSDWSVIRTLNLAVGNSCAIWTFDDRYLITFPRNLNYFLVYSRTSNFSQIKNISLAYKNTKKCIAHQKTNSYLCMGGLPAFYFSLNLFDFSIASLLDGFIASYYKASENLNFFVSYHHDRALPVFFYQIHKYCTGNTFYHI